MPSARRHNGQEESTTRRMGYTPEGSMCRTNPQSGNSSGTTLDVPSEALLHVSGRPLAFVASLDVIQRQGAIRDNTRRSGGFVGCSAGDGLICLCPSQPTLKAEKRESQITSDKTNIEKIRRK